MDKKKCAKETIESQKDLYIGEAIDVADNCDVTEKLVEEENLLENDNPASNFGPFNTLQKDGE